MNKKNRKAQEFMIGDVLMTIGMVTVAIFMTMTMNLMFSSHARSQANAAIELKEVATETSNMLLLLAETRDDKQTSYAQLIEMCLVDESQAYLDTGNTVKQQLESEVKDSWLETYLDNYQLQVTYEGRVRIEFSSGDIGDGDVIAVSLDLPTEENKIAQVVLKTW